MKSSFNRSAGKLLGLFNETDLGKDGINRIENKNFALDTASGVTASGGNTSAQPLSQDGISYKYHVWHLAAMRCILKVCILQGRSAFWRCECA